MSASGRSDARSPPRQAAHLERPGGFSRAIATLSRMAEPEPPVGVHAVSAHVEILGRRFSFSGPRRRVGSSSNCVNALESTSSCGLYHPCEGTDQERRARLRYPPSCVPTPRLLLIGITDPEQSRGTCAGKETVVGVCVRKRIHRSAAGPPARPPPIPPRLAHANCLPMARTRPQPEGDQRLPAARALVCARGAAWRRRAAVAGTLPRSRTPGPVAARLGLAGPRARE